ncbi:MAG: response regulator [bacterium]|nr:response regulator [bacterium]
MAEAKMPIVLTIDDEKAIRSSFKNFLEDYDYTVYEAENGRVGLDVFSRVKPDLVLVDLRMPEVDGLQVLAEVAGKSPDTPIIVVSGTGVMGEAVEALHLGAWDYLLKPVEDLSVLLHAVEKALERSRLIRENRTYQEHLEEKVALRTKQLRTANEALRESEENLSITLDSIGDAVIATNPVGMIVRMNPVAEQLTGWSLEEAKGMHLDKVFDIIDADTRETVPSPLGKVMKSGKIVELEKNTILINRNKSELRIADSGAPILQKDGAIAGLVLVFRDVSEQYRLEEQLKQSQKMDAIGQLAGGVAHDFNNMLGGIIGAADLLALKSVKDEKSAKYITIIQDAGKRAADLTRKLLDFSRKGKATNTIVDLHKLGRETVRILERSIDRRIAILENFRAPCPTVNGDPSQLQNALLNLAINARDAMPAGGTLTLSTTHIQLDESFCAGSVFDIQPGLYIEMCVADTGTGMSKNVRERIFEPFFTTKGAGKGTGLGLASVYGMIRNHQGAIKVESQLEKGTVFKIYLPPEKGTLEKRDESSGDAEILGGSGCVLVVDDEDIMLAMTVEMLSDAGYEVLTAKNGLEAVELYKKNPGNIDLVLLDMVMPRLNGKDTFYVLKDINPEVKVLLTSGYTKDSELVELRRNGVCGYIQKPFRGSQLIRQVNDILGSSQDGGSVEITKE